MTEKYILMMMGVIFSQNNALESDTMLNFKIFNKIDIMLKNDYIKDTRIRRTYPRRKIIATCYVYLNSSPYCDAEGLSQLRSCF